MGCLLIIADPSVAQQASPALQPTPQSSPIQPGIAPPYRAPAITLVQPAGGAALPQDKPVAVFRFMQGEQSDPIDLATFVVLVDAVDRTPLFQVTAGEAWGLLVSPNDSALAEGAHQVTARICSARGACADLSATVSVVAAAASGAAAEKPAPARRRKLIDAVLDIARRLLVP